MQTHLRIINYTRDSDVKARVFFQMQIHPYVCVHVYKYEFRREQASGCRCEHHRDLMVRRIKFILWDQLFKQITENSICTIFQISQCMYLF